MKAAHEAKRRRDWFLFGLVAAVALAWIAPNPGAPGGWLHPEIVNKLGVALIFFLHGAGLSFAALKSGTLRWRVHLLVQTATFLLFPLMGLGMLRLLRDVVPRDLALGVFFLCALPSTVSSSVALTAAARGNVPAAVFNATLSNLLGVLATPLWLGLVLRTSGQGGLPLGKVVLDLVMWLVLPLATGQLCRPWLGEALRRNKGAVTAVDRLTILTLVYTSFCDSVKRNVWSGQELAALLTTRAVSIAMLTTVILIVRAASIALRLPIEDRITAIFCGSKKTLASGVPMAQLIFHGHPALSLILLPLLIYHPLQLVVCGWLASRWGRRPPAAADSHP
jgi:sodium/bile acid cotransporter 7